jgi:hypothetical protein
MNVYAFELNPAVTITFTNLKLTFSKLPKNIEVGSIWSLYYVTKMVPEVITNVSSYTYTDNIHYPIVLPLAIPSTNNWENNTTNGVVYYFNNTFKDGNLNSTNIIDISNNNNIITGISGSEYAIKNLTNFIKLVGNTNLLSITDVFLIYNPLKDTVQSWAITNLKDDKTNEPIIAPLLYLSLMYTPKNCSNSLLYSDKCIPSCPAGFNYDLGLICLNSNPSLYLPDSELCNYINDLSLTKPINPIIEGIKLGCDKKYFDNNKTINQADVTGSLLTIPSNTKV